MKMKNGNFLDAESHFKIAIASNPTNGSAHSNYGTLLCQQSRYDAGMESFGKALQYPKFTKVAQTLVNGGICLLQKGDNLAAEKFLLKALEQEPFMPAALYQLSKVYFLTNRLDQAESRLNALHKQVQANAASTFLLYQIAIAKGNAQQAQNYAKTILTRFPASQEASLIKQ
jgi:type IV pilus assembly protein PilF